MHGNQDLAWSQAVGSSSFGDIYVVDDDPAALDALTIVLQLEGFRVRGFDDAASFLAAARERAPSAVILDVVLGAESGLDLLRKLNAAGKYPAPVLMVSGHGTIPMAVEAIRCGAHDFISKPFEADRIVDTLRELAVASTAKPAPNGVRRPAAMPWRPARSATTAAARRRDRSTL